MHTSSGSLKMAQMRGLRRSIIAEVPSDTSYYTAAIGTGLVGSGLRPTENCRRLSAASVEA